MKETTLGEVLGQHLRRTLQEQRNGQQTASSNSRSQRTKAFKEKFPTIEILTSYFCPSNWRHALEHIQECATYPSATLKEIDALYDKKGLAERIIEMQLTGIYKMSVMKNEMEYRGVSEAASVFVGAHGHHCTMYAMMIYFGKYLSDYKEGYAQFDMSDILRQFNVKFLPWWRSLLSHTEPEKPAPSGRPTGIEGLRQYLRNSIREGYDLRQGGLYAMNVITDKDIRQAEEEVRQGIF